MRYRKNRRENNLAAVTPEKAAEDAHNTAGLFAAYSFFEKADRQPLKVKLDPNLKIWTYENEKQVISGRYMYAIGKNGGLYIGTGIVVHSQIKAGKEVQSAGWLTYEREKENPGYTLTIDNCSGHYIPTLSQFIETLRGLHSVGMVPDTFKIKLSKFTKFDPSYPNAEFWSSVVALAQGDESPIINVTYQADSNDFAYAVEQNRNVLTVK